MKRTLLSTAIVICTVVFLAGLQAANAEFIGDMKDSADFSWCYEMDVDPLTQDLDSNAGVDWALIRGTVVVNGNGTITLAEDNDERFGCLISAYGSNEPTWSSDGAVWRNITDATGYTVEIRVKSAGTKVYNSGTGTGGGYFLATDDDTSELYAPVVILNEKTVWSQGSNTIDTNANDDDYHIFRIVQNPDSNTYYVWRDDELIRESTGVNSTSWNRLQLGDMGGAAGPIVVDYIRLTAGAYAPVPEPSTLALLAAGLVGLLAYAWKKRK